MNDEQRAALLRAADIIKAAVDLDQVRGEIAVEERNVRMLRAEAADLRKQIAESEAEHTRIRSMSSETLIERIRGLPIPPAA